MTPERDINRLIEQEHAKMKAEQETKPDGAAQCERAPTPESIAAGWRNRLLRSTRGGVLAVVANAITALRHAPEWQGVLHFNESSLATVVKAAPPFESASSVPFTWADEHDVLTAAWLQHQDIRVTKDIAAQAVQTVSLEHTFHPIRDYLDSLKWDGVKRVDDWLTLYLGADPSDLVRAVGAKFLIGAVARVYKPGAKNDTCPILEGPQGAQKSTALLTLAGSDFFSDDIAELGSKDSVMQTRGVWIIELSELDALTKGDVSRIKAFMSRQVDRIRPPYGKRVIAVARECVFVGTVNKETYLKDETGSRRFLPVKCGVIKIAELARDRDQLWAEARERFCARDTWWLDKQHLIESAAKEAQARYEGDPWDDLITEWLKDPTERRDASGHPVTPLRSSPESVTVPDILVHCIGKLPSMWSQADQSRVGRSLTAKGWRRKQKRAGDEREWRYFPPVTSVTTSSL
jgi:predicted P-loop ATPase